MEEEDQLPLKRVELSLQKFNEVAIPHHLDLLRQHRANIVKHAASGAWVRVRAEQEGAARAAARLRALLAELGALRRRVRAPDRAAFDEATRRAQDTTLRAVRDYLETGSRIAGAEAATATAATEQSDGARAEPEPTAGSSTSTESVGLVLRLQLDEQEAAALAAEELAAREAALRGWRALQLEVCALHEAWCAVHAAARDQRDQVQAAAGGAERAAGDVVAARSHLALAERLGAGALGACGALAGALAGGPLGLLVGAKAGAAAALAGSTLGYLGGRLVGRRRRLQLEGAAPPAAAEPRKER